MYFFSLKHKIYGLFKKIKCFFFVYTEVSLFFCFICSLFLVLCWIFILCLPIWCNYCMKFLLFLFCWPKARTFPSFFWAQKWKNSNMILWNILKVTKKTCVKVGLRKIQVQKKSIFLKCRYKYLLFVKMMVLFNT